LYFFIKVPKIVTQESRPKFVQSLNGGMPAPSGKAGPPPVALPLKFLTAFVSIQTKYWIGNVLMVY
jgi:hypothetical protein